MIKSKAEHRIAYWKYHVAAHSFSQALDVATRLKGITGSHDLFHPLMLSLHVFYARPFIQEKESRCLETTLVPADLRSVHDILLSMRDRIFAHHDKNSKLIDADTGVDLFQLIVVINNGQIRPGLQLVFPTPYQIGKVYSLCEHLHAICMKKASEYFVKCVKVIPTDGIYRVTTNFEGRAPLLLKSQISNEQSSAHLKETKRRMSDA